VELLAQPGGLAIAAPPAGAAPERLQLRVAAIGPIKFPAAASAGAMLEAHARVAGQIGGLFKIEGTVTADGVLVATGSLTLAG
jgi:3-hydroxymyristoyl/3-hydroxydecanoyl-(acyl carrier protein) dehydratase